MKKINFLVLFFFALALGQIILGLSKVLWRTNLIDFQVYYEASQDFLHGINPYQNLYHLKIPFNYPPSAFLFFLPLVFLPLKVSQIAWLTLSFFCLAAFVWLLFRLYLPKEKLWLKVLIISFLLQNFPTKFTLVMGQVNFLVLFLIVASFFFYLKQRDNLSGFFLGLAVAIKISPILLIIFFLTRKKLKIVISALFTFGVANFIFVFSSLGAVNYYFRTRMPSLLQTATQGVYYDQSFLSFFFRLGSKGMIGSIFNLAFFVGGVILLFFKFKKTKDSLSDLRFFSLLLLLITITNSFTWQHHFVFLFPAFLSATFYLLKKKRPLYGLILAVAAFLVGFHFRDLEYFLLTNSIIASHGLLGALILGGLLLR